MNGLLCKDGNWIYKIRVPKALANHPDFRGKEFIRRALGTKDRSVAEKNALIVAGEIEAAFRRARDEVEAVNKPRYVDSMTIAEMDAFIDGAISDARHWEQVVPHYMPEIASIPGRCLPKRGQLIEWYARERRMVLAPNVAEALRERYVEYQSTPRPRPIPEVGQLGAIRGHGTANREQVLAEAMPSTTEVEELHHLRSVYGTPKTRRYTVGDLIVAFLSEPDRKDLSASTKSTYTTPIELLTDCLGRERRLDTITKLDLKREIRDSVLRCIPTFAKHTGYWPEYEGWNYPDIAKDFKARVEDGEEVVPMEEGSIKKYCGAIGKIFSYAAEHGMIPANPADKLYSRPKDAPIKPPKQPFQSESLKKIFPKDWMPQDDVDWMLAIGLLHGFRGNEAAQIGADDIIEHEGFQCIRISDGGWKKTKNAPTNRIIPIHPKLIELGFWRLATERRDGGHPRVLETIPYSGDYCYGSIRGDIKERLEKLGVWDATHTYHSFRHTFQLAVKNCGVDHAKGQALGGWSQGGGSEQGYGKINGHGFEIKTLVPEIAKIRHPIHMFGESGS